MRWYESTATSDGISYLRLPPIIEEVESGSVEVQLDAPFPQKERRSLGHAELLSGPDSCVPQESS